MDHEASSGRPLAERTRRASTWWSIARCRRSVRCPLRRSENSSAAPRGTRPRSATAPQPAAPAVRSPHARPKPVAPTQIVAHSRAAASVRQGEPPPWHAQHPGDERVELAHAFDKRRGDHHADAPAPVTPLDRGHALRGQRNRAAAPCRPSGRGRNRPGCRSACPGSPAAPPDAARGRRAVEARVAVTRIVSAGTGTPILSRAATAATAGYPQRSTTGSASRTAAASRLLPHASPPQAPRRE